MAVTTDIYYKSNDDVTVIDIVANPTSGYTKWTIVDGDPPWQLLKSRLTSITVGRSNNKISPRYCSSWFTDCYKLTTLDISGLDTSNVTSMEYMFGGCNALTSLDVSGFNTSNVTNMSAMFASCRSLTSLDVSGFNTSKVTNMHAMFQSLYKITSLDVSGLVTSNVTDMGSMFSGCYLLTSLNMSGFNTSKVTDMNYMFSNCQVLTSLDVSMFDTSNVTKMYNMFYNCKKLTSLDLSGWNTSKVTDMDYMFSDCQKLTTLTLSSNFDTSNVDDMRYMFYHCFLLTSLDLSGFNTSKVTNMHSMFSDCQYLETLTLSSNFDTSNVTDMGFMFHLCRLLTSLDVSGFDTSKVTNMVSMFAYCRSLTSSGFDVSGFNTSNVTNMSGMFQGCEALTSLDVSRFDTSKVTSISSMFCGCSSLTSLDVSGFDTSNADGMNQMFDNCSSLTSLDVSGFDTSKVDWMQYMFRDCSSLTSLDVSGFDISNVTKILGMFSGCNNLMSLDLSSWNGLNITDMSNMFRECSALTGTIYINANPSNYSGMFYNTTQEIILTGSSSILNSLAATANNNNVYVWSLNVRPIAERDEDNGSLLHISAEVTRSMSDAVPIVINVYRNDSSTPMSLIWHESLIMDVNPKTFTTEIGNVDENTSTNYTFVVSDAYGTGLSKTITVPTNYYTLDFLAGGKEIAFGQKAEAKDLFELLAAEPSDWSTDWTDYYEIDNSGKFVPVSDATAPTFAADTYYKKIHESLFKCAMDSSFNDMTPTEVSDFISDLDISGSPIELTQADWVVEQGITGDWTWRKWQSGIAECWGVFLHTTTVSGAWGTGFLSNVKVINFPTDLFVSPPSGMSMYVDSTWAGLSACENQIATKDWMRCYVFRTSSTGTSTPDFYIHIDAKGRWK